MNRSPLPYAGGKTRAVKHLMPLIPKDVRRVVSAFCGACSLEIALAMSGIVVLAFDTLPKLVNFWNVLRESPDLLADRVQLIYREFGKDCFHRLQRVSCSFNRINQAASYYAIKRSQFNRAESGGYALGHPRLTESSIRLIQEFQWPKLLSVSFQDFRDTLRLYLSDFLFLDPPYNVLDNLYGYRGVDWCHEELAAQLRNHKGRFLLCYNDDQYIHDLYKGYMILEASHLWKYGANESRDASEIFILNYELTEKQLIESGFDPSRINCKPSDALSRCHHKFSAAEARDGVLGNLGPEKLEGNLVLFNEDCVQGSKQHIPNDCVDLIINDPPFGIGESNFPTYNRDSSHVRQGYVEAPRGSEEYYLWTKAWMREAFRILRPGGTLYVVIGFTRLREVMNAATETGFELLNELIWRYDFGVDTDRMQKYVTSHYSIPYYVKPGGTKTYNRQCRFSQDKRDILTGNSLNYADREDVFDIRRDRKLGRDKNANKLPPELIKKLIQYLIKRR